MNTFFKWIGIIGNAIHWLTGWLVHPNRGGCCEQDAIKEKLKSEVENLKK